MQKVLDFLKKYWLIIAIVLACIIAMVVINVAFGGIGAIIALVVSHSKKKDKVDKDTKEAAIDALIEKEKSDRNIKVEGIKQSIAKIDADINSNNIHIQSIPSPNIIEVNKKVEAINNMTFDEASKEFDGMFK